MGLSREQLGQKIGRSKETIGQWERGVTSPDLEDAVKLARVFDCTIDYLAGITEHRKPQNVFLIEMPPRQNRRRKST